MHSKCVNMGRRLGLMFSTDLITDLAITNEKSISTTKERAGNPIYENLQRAHSRSTLNNNKGNCYELPAEIPQ